MDRQEIAIGLEVAANVNGVAFGVAGEIHGAVGGGGGWAQAEASKDVPPGFSMALLPYVLMTGQPSLSLTPEGTVNPFIKSGGVYRATRTLDLGERGRLTTRYSVDRNGKGLQANFNMSGSVEVPRLTRVLPTLETWVPAGRGKIRGHFTMVWQAESGDCLKGEAETEYLLPLEQSLPDVQYRYIEISLTPGERTVRQSERIIILTPAKLAELASLFKAAA